MIGEFSSGGGMIDFKWAFFGSVAAIALAAQLAGDDLVPGIVAANERVDLIVKRAYVAKTHGLMVGYQAYLNQLQFAAAEIDAAIAPRLDELVQLIDADTDLDNHRAEIEALQAWMIVLEDIMGHIVALEATGVDEFLPPFGYMANEMGQWIGTCVEDSSGAGTFCVPRTTVDAWRFGGSLLRNPPLDGAARGPANPVPTCLAFLSPKTAGFTVPGLSAANAARRPRRRGGPEESAIGDFIRSIRQAPASQVGGTVTAAPRDSGTVTPESPGGGLGQIEWGYLDSKYSYYASFLDLDAFDAGASFSTAVVPNVKISQADLNEVPVEMFHPNTEWRVDYPGMLHAPRGDYKYYGEGGMGTTFTAGDDIRWENYLIRNKPRLPAFAPPMIRLPTSHPGSPASRSYFPMSGSIVRPMRPQ